MGSLTVGTPARRKAWRRVSISASPRSAANSSPSPSARRAVDMREPEARDVCVMGPNNSTSAFSPRNHTRVSPHARLCRRVCPPPRSFAAERAVRPWVVVELEMFGNGSTITPPISKRSVQISPNFETHLVRLGTMPGGSEESFVISATTDIPRLRRVDGWWRKRGGGGCQMVLTFFLF